jgi:hypothetical protein
MVATSILISTTPARLPYFKRTLHYLKQLPEVAAGEVELVVCVEVDSHILSTGCYYGNYIENIRSYEYPLTYIEWHREEYEAKTGLTKYFNCSAPCINAAWKNCGATDYIVWCGDEIIAWNKDTLSALLYLIKDDLYGWASAEVWDLPKHLQYHIGEYGEGLTQEDIDLSKDRVMASNRFDNLVPNYFSVFTTEVWERLGGVNENYIEGIGFEDQDFVQRFFNLPNHKRYLNGSLVIHQSHGMKTHLGDNDPSVISNERLERGISINRELYHNRDKSAIKNIQSWEPGSLGVSYVTRLNHDR